MEKRFTDPRIAERVVRVFIDENSDYGSMPLEPQAVPVEGTDQTATWMEGRVVVPWGKFREFVRGVGGDEYSVSVTVFPGGELVVDGSKRAISYLEKQAEVEK